MKETQLSRWTLVALVITSLFYLRPAFSSDPNLEIDLVIPIVARAPGLHGTVWQTRLELLNPDGGFSGEDVRMCFWPSDQPNVDPTSCVDKVLHGFEEKIWNDVLLDAFGIERGVGFLTISGRIFAHAQVFNENGVDGTYGQFVPSVPPSWSFPLGAETQYPAETRFAYFPSVVESEQHRTNLGIINLGERAMRFILYFWEYPHITPEGGREVVVPPRSMVQLNRVLSEYCHGAAYCDAMVTVAQREEPEVQFLAYISRVDNLTGDAVFIPAHSNLLALVPPKPPECWLGVKPNDRQSPNKSFQTDRDPRERGSRPLNSNR